MKKTTVAMVLAISLNTTLNAAPQALNDEALSLTQGAGGADISLNLRWNLAKKNNADSSLTSDYQYSCASGDSKWCRLGITPANRTDGNGKKEWIVFNKIQGAIEVPKLGIDSANLQYSANGSTVYTQALQLSFNKADVIKVRNFGFESLSVNKDSQLEPAADNTPGYVSNTTTYASGYSYAGGTAGAFDNGKELGFIGLNINADIELQGTIKVFSCPVGVC